MDERVSTGEFLSVDPTVPAWGPEVIAVNDSDNTGTWFCYDVSLALSSLTLLLALVGLAGNATVLWLLSFRMRRTPFSVYILNLAGADFLFLAFQMIFNLDSITALSHSTSFPAFFYILSKFSYFAGLSLLSAISTERCLSVLWPIWYRGHRPRHTSAIVCALLWIVSLVLSLLEGHGCGLLSTFSDRDLCRTFDFTTTGWLVVLFVVLSGSSLALLLRVFGGSRRIPVTRLYVTLVLAVLVFLLFGLPFGTYWLFLCINSYKNTCVYEVTVVLSCVNSCANPIIYFFVGSFRHHRSQRRTLKLILQRAMQDTPEEEEGGDKGPAGAGNWLIQILNFCFRQRDVALDQFCP